LSLILEAKSVIDKIFVEFHNRVGGYPLVE